MTPIEIFRVAMVWLAMSSAGSSMGCDNVAARATLCWVRDGQKQQIIWIDRSGYWVERVKPVVRVTPMPVAKTPKGGKK